MGPVAQLYDAGKWQPHPEVWLLIAGAIGIAWYVTRVIGPKLAPEGQPLVTTRQKVFFWSAVAIFWIASDWPIHDVSEDYLYSLHMFQHMLITFVMPPLFLLATPTWLARLVVGSGGGFSRMIRFPSRPVVAGLIFNLLFALFHWPAVVNVTVEIGPLHYGAHLILVVAAFFMWMPVCGPIPEWRLAPPAQMFYLFVMSIIPTVPAAWLVFADSTVYEVYNRPQRLLGIGVIDDQQAAGLIMKILGGIYLWVIIATIFFRWASSQEQADRDRVVVVTENELVTEDSPLTWDQVRAELEGLSSSPAPSPTSDDVTPSSNPSP